jgi:hypothetical protein
MSIILSTLFFFWTADVHLAAADQGEWTSDGGRQTTDNRPQTADDGEGGAGQTQDALGMAGCAVSGRFPAGVLRWCDLITQQARKHGLHPDLVAALILQESAGNPDAYSHSGAVGLMQVMPRDGIAASFMCINGPCFADRPSTAQLKDPQYNVAYGARMLAGLVKRYGGDVRQALKSYGPAGAGYYYADKVLGHFQRYGNP